MTRTLLLLTAALLLAGCGDATAPGGVFSTATPTPAPTPVVQKAATPTPKPGNWMWKDYKPSLGNPTPGNRR